MVSACQRQFLPHFRTRWQKNFDRTVTGTTISNTIHRLYESCRKISLTLVKHLLTMSARDASNRFGRGSFRAGSYYSPSQVRLEVPGCTCSGNDRQRELG